jgi:hypothetical protein
MESKTVGIIGQSICCTEANPGPIPSSIMLRPQQIPKLKFRDRFLYDEKRENLIYMLYISTILIINFLKINIFCAVSSRKLLKVSFLQVLSILDKNFQQDLSKITQYGTWKRNLLLIVNWCEYIFGIL